MSTDLSSLRLQNRNVVVSFRDYAAGIDRKRAEKQETVRSLYKEAEEKTPGQIIRERSSLSPCNISRQKEKGDKEYCPYCL